MRPMPKKKGLNIAVLWGFVVVAVVITLFLNNSMFKNSNDMRRVYKEAMDLSDLLTRRLEGSSNSVAHAREMMNSLPIPYNGYVFLLDKSGNALIHPDMEGSNLTRFLDRQSNAVYAVMLKEKRGFVAYYYQRPSDTNIYKYLVAFQALPRQDWLIGVAFRLTND